MTSDTDPMLESEHLDQLLDTPAPPQPVVVVQYRNRGVPPWLFFPFAIIVTLAALFVYHRMVVERYRVQAMEERSLLVRQIKEERARLPLVRDASPSKAVLPEPGSAVAGSGADEDTGFTISASDTPTTVVAASAKGQSNPSPSRSVADAGPTPVQSQPRSTDPASPGPAGVVSPAGTLPDQTGSVADAASRNPFAQEKTAAITTRSVVPDPFAELANPSEPPAPNDGAGLAVDAGQTGKTSSAETKGLASATVDGSNRGRMLVISSDKPRDAPAAPGSGAAAAEVAKRDGRAGPQPLPPLPTREENLRAFEEEAAKKEAERVARFENRDADLRARRVQEQLKFREELREVLRTKESQAGPDIAKLSQRYDYDVDPDKHAQAYKTWRFSRISVSEKMRIIRELGLPEITILQFMCSSLNPLIGTRKGPRDENEVWVRAAKQFLRYQAPRVPGGPRPGAGGGAGPAPTPKTVVSTPR